MRWTKQGQQRGTIEAFFTSSNYLFSTKAKDSKETLYFKDRTTGQTGRLRQEHESRPLEKRDKKARRHKFVSKKRFKTLREWYKAHPKQLPRFYSYEQRATVGKHHIEFAFEKGKVSGWHNSRGTVETNRQCLNGRIASALEGIRIRSKTIEK